VTWRELRVDVERRLGSAVDAGRIVEEACGDDWRLRLDEAVSTRAAVYVEQMVTRRLAGEPLQYVVGRWGFRRPETESVVEVALEALESFPSRPTVVDLGTGSGAIALSLAAETSDAKVWATDRSSDAMAVARANLAGLGRSATRVRLVEGSWFDALPPLLRGTVQLVVANPPYVSEGEMLDLPPEVAHWEPRQALVSGPTGLEDVEAIVTAAPVWLARPGAIVVELAPRQAEAAVVLAVRAGFTEVEIRPDLAGRPRALYARVGFGS
jgi:release factor glutamine methyltransferase